jgi:hypothetical protein
MKLLDKIVDTINDNLMGGVLNDRAFQSSFVNGLAYLTTPKDDSPQRPYIIDGENVKDISIDDSYDFNIYHRCNDITFTDAVASAWGDGNGMIAMTCSMVAIVYANRFGTGYTQEDLIMKLSSGLNLTLSKVDLGTSGLTKVRATVQRANNNSLAVFQGEYGPSANCPLAMDSIYFAISYTIDITAHSKCLECQDCR